MRGLQAVPSVTLHVVLYIHNGLIEIRLRSLTIGQHRLLPFPSFILPPHLSSLSLSVFDSPMSRQLKASMTLSSLRVTLRRDRVGWNGMECTVRGEVEVSGRGQWMEH